MFGNNFILPSACCDASVVDLNPKAITFLIEPNPGADAPRCFMMGWGNKINSSFVVRVNRIFI